MWTREEQRMNETIFENLPRKMNLISDLFSRVVFRDKEDLSGPGTDYFRGRL